jgi:hypothetical protein
MRDDFPSAAADTLAKRVGVRCSNPECQRATAGPRTDAAKVVNIGVAAHITAASTGGPRYDESMSSEERRSVDNGIWLCQNCAKLIDNDEGRFTVMVLREWKTKSETRALAALAGAPPADAELAAAAEVALRRRNVSINAEQHNYRLEVVATNLAGRPLGDYHVDLQFPNAVVSAPEQHPLYVPNRSSPEVAFFRYAATAPKHAIYPGDSAALITLDYEMNTALFSRRDHLLQLPVVASLYCGGAAPVVVETPFEQLQCF